MALHTPAHPLGTTHHPHTLRYALIAVIAAIAVIAGLVAADVVKLAVPSSGTAAADRLLTSEMIEFRAGERAALSAVAPADQLLTPSLIEFRASERSLVNPNEYNGPH